jgi:hypothetical protein
MTIPEAFKKAIAQPFHLQADIKNNLRIKENDISCDSCKWVEILLNDLSKTFCFSIDLKDKKDGFDPVFPFFNTDEKTSIAGLRSKNDAIVIYQSEHKIFVFLIELKSKNSGNYLQQLALSKVFVTFIVDRLSMINSSYEFKKQDIEFRGILFRYQKKVQKEISRKKGQVQYESKNGLLVSELPCHQQYRIQYFLS